MISENDLIIDSEIRPRIEEELKKSTKDVNIITAYCKLSSLSYFDQFISPGVTKKLLVRFLPSDISSGATDKGIYEYCKENGWTLFFDFNMHAKTYIFDKLKCVIGSANLTNSGLGLSSTSNTEVLGFFTLDDSSYNKIINLYKDSRKMDDELFNKIVSCTNDEEIRTSSDRTINLCSEIEILLPEDFPTDETEKLDLFHLKSYIWLREYLKGKEDHYAYFGELSEKIHSLFIKDPRPYRKDIKNHLADLLNSIKKYEINDFIIDVPNHSERITLIVD